MEQVFCPACKNEHIISEDLCRICQFPFNDTQKEKSIHIGRFIGEKGIIQDSNDNLDKSRNLLFLVAMLNIVSIVINYKLIFQNVLVAIITLSIPAIIIVSALLIKKSPIVFLSIPLLLMLTIYLIEYILNPYSLLRGIVLKVFVVGLLGYSIYNYIISQNFKKRYNQ